MKIELTEQQGIDLVALLVNHSALVDVWFEDNEPANSLSHELGEHVLKQLIEDGLSITDVDLHLRVAELVVTGSNLNNDSD